MVQSSIPHHRQIPDLQGMRIPQMFLLGLFVLLYDVWVGYAYAEIYGIGDGVVRLTVLIGRIGVCVETVDSAVSGLHFELFVVPSLLLLLPGSFHLLGLRHVHLIPMRLMVVVKLFLPFPRLPPLFLIHLVLQKTLEHIFLMIHPANSLLLVLQNPLLKFLYLSFLEVIAVLLSLPVNNRSLVFVDVVEGVLVFHELVVVLFVDRVFLGLHLVADHDLSVVLLFLSLLLLFLPPSHLLTHGQLLLGYSLLLLHGLSLPDVVLLHAPAVELVHFLLLLKGPPPFLLSPPLLLLSQLQILPAQLVLDLVLVALHTLDLPLHELMIVDCFLEVPSFLKQSLMPLLQFCDLRVVVVVPGWGEGYLTILLLRVPISLLV